MLHSCCLCNIFHRCYQANHFLARCLWMIYELHCIHGMKADLISLMCRINFINTNTIFLCTIYSLCQRKIFITMLDILQKLQVNLLIVGLRIEILYIFLFIYFFLKKIETIKRSFVRDIKITLFIREKFNAESSSYQSNITRLVTETFIHHLIA